MKTAVNRYGGLNKDMSYDSVPPQFYIDALDVRITTSDGESQGSITNIKGNTLSFIIPDSGTIIGTTNIRNLIIFATVHSTGVTSRLYKIEYNDVDHSINTGAVLIYESNDLNFSTTRPLEMLGRFESGNVQRIYFTDYQEPLRSMNILDPDLSTTPVDLLSVNPALQYTQPLLSTISGGGVLPTGLYQFAYKLITTDGKETLISPPSNMIHIVSDSETLLNSDAYSGDPKGTITNKAVVITIDATNYTDYAKIELIAIFHEDYKGIPVITSVESQNITGTSVEFTYTGSEDSIFSISIDDFTLKQYPFSTCKTLTQVDSSLLIGNLKSGSFSMQDLLGSGETFDVSTLRYNSAGESMVGKNNFRKVGSPVYTADEVKFNVTYNEDSHWDSRWHTDGQFKYKSNGTTLGGEGANISYEFVLEPLVLKSSTSFGSVTSTPATTHNLSDGYTYNNTTFDTTASPFISGLLKGYKRGETYRFALVGYKGGQASFAEFIGDIKFPDISEESDSVNSSGELYYPLSKHAAGETTGYNMGIQFTLDFSSCATLLSQIDSYQIVRVERKDEDKRRLSSGGLRVFSLVPFGAPPSGGWDLSIGGGSNVLHLWHYGNIPGSNYNQNGSFTYLPSRAALAGNYHNVFGDYISHFGPELSFEFGNVKENIIGGSSPMLLVTGGLNYTGSYWQEYDTSGTEQLGTAVQDQELRFDHCSKVNKTSGNGYEYIKLLTNPVYSKFGNKLTDNDADVANVTGLIDGYYLRNFYAENVDTDELNVPNGNGSFFKGCQSILGRMTKVQIDPLTGSNLSSTGVVSGQEYFDTTYVSSAGSGDDQVICDVLIPKLEIYGGFNNSALENNAFIPASPVIDKSNLTPKVFGGDIFLNLFTHQTASTYNNPSYYDGAAVSPNQVFRTNRSITNRYVVESTINTELNYGGDIKRGVRFDVAGGTGGVKSRIYRQESNNYDTTYGKTTATMYAYNDVYSEEATDLNFFVKPSSYVDSLVNDIRVALSNVKINNEEIDSWSKFLINNYYDVDDHGPINKLIKSGNNTLFFQDSAIGTLLINPVNVVTGSTGVPTNLGSGEGITKHQYLTTENGSIHQWAVRSTDKGVYYFDALARKIFVVGQGNQSLSEIKGLHGFLNSISGDIFLRKENGGDNPLLNAGVVIGQDKNNDEVLFTFKGIDIKGLVDPISYTLVFDENAQQFSSFYSAKPSIYLSNNNILLSPDPSSPARVHIHNEGDYGTFYGNIEECYVKMVVNDNSDVQKVLRFIEFNSIVRDDNKIQTRTETITAFQIDTETQSTGKVAFSTDRFKHKFNKWRLKIPRDQNSVSQKGRLRNTYFIVTLYFDNTTNKELILNKMLAHYDIQMF